MARSPGQPMMATPASSLPIGPKWSYEVKWDGYRALLTKDQSSVSLVSRNQKNLSADFPSIVKAGRTLTDEPFVLDGEIVAVDAKGQPSFQALQHRATSSLTVVYYAFDLLRLGDVDLRRKPLAERREQLHRLLFKGPILLSQPLPGSPDQIETTVRAAGLEGIVAKRIDSLYESGTRSDRWIKVRFSRRQEFVVGGYKPADRNFDSVLVGYYEGRKLFFAGKVRAGFMAHTRAELFARLNGDDTAKCPFVNLPNSAGKSHWGEGLTAEDMLSLRWVKPRIVIEVAFTEWTAGGNLRHAAYVGLREDKAAKTVVRET